MRTTLATFDLLAWRIRMDWCQDEAASALGVSTSGYRHMEYRNQDRAGSPCNKTIALLATLLERGRGAHPNNGRPT